jgi:hypothetical protein
LVAVLDKYKADNNIPEEQMEIVIPDYPALGILDPILARKDSANSLASGMTSKRSSAMES